MNTKNNIYAIADIGANTVKCSVYALGGAVDEPPFRELGSMSEKLGLYARAVNSRLTSDAVGDLCAALCRFREEAAHLGAGELYAYATASLRGITNFAEVNRAVIQTAGCPITLLSGSEEARLSFAGFRYENKSITDGLMADMGGGSTELLAFDASGMTGSHSFPFGCLHLCRKFVSGVLPTSDECADIYSYVREIISPHTFIHGAETLCLVGGTGKAIGKLVRKYGLSNKKDFPTTVFHELCERLKRPSAEDYELISALLPDRRELVIPGMTAYRAIADECRAERISVTAGGLREGCMLALHEKNKENI